MAAGAVFEAADAIREMTNPKVEKCQPDLPKEETWQVGWLLGNPWVINHLPWYTLLVVP